MNDFVTKKCKPCEGGVAPLTPDTATKFFQQLDGWQLQAKQIRKQFKKKSVGL